MHVRTIADNPNCNLSFAIGLSEDFCGSKEQKDDFSKTVGLGGVFLRYKQKSLAGLSTRRQQDLGKK